MPFFGPTASRVDPTHVRLIRLLVRYHDEGDYRADIVAVGRRALAGLQAGATDARRPALVLDVDETSLANDWPRLLRVGTDAVAGDHYSYYDAAAWSQWVDEARAPAIEATLEVYRAARKLRWDVFFITGRPEAQRDATERNLVGAGFDGWTGLILRGQAALNVDASVYKSAARASIANEGYRIVVNVGDQASDLSGGNGDHTFKWPNPFYFVA